LEDLEAEWADVPWPTEPPDDYGHQDHNGSEYEPTTWEPVDLGPWLRGEITPPEPTVGAARTDGLRLFYPGREHSVIGATESGKTWLTLASAVAEMDFRRTVVYIHFEESDPGSTLERLQLLGATPEAATRFFRFVAPSRPSRREWIAPLVAERPALVVLDGVNEAMTLHGAETAKVEGWSDVRRRVVTPFTRAGAAVVSCDHLPMNTDGTRRDAYGTVHKGAAIDGSRVLLENAQPFGRGCRGVSYVFITKDRPGYLRAYGRPTKTAGKTFMGTLIVDDATTGPDFRCGFYAPRDDEKTPETDPAEKMRDDVYDVVYGLADRTVSSSRLLFAELRKAGHQYRDDDVRRAADDLLVAGRFEEVAGKRGARGYRAVVTVSASGSASTYETASRTASHHLPTAGGTQSDAVVDATASECRDAVGRSGTQSETVETDDSTDSPPGSVPVRRFWRRSRKVKLPEGGKSVAYPSKFANPYRPGRGERSAENNAVAVWLYAEDLHGFRDARQVKATVEDVHRELAEASALACYCEPWLPCHVDVLLDVLGADQ
jgi:hypothetical protein